MSKKKKIETKAIQLANGIMTVSARAYLFLNKKFADLTKVTVEEALIAVNEYFKNQL